MADDEAVQPNLLLNTQGLDNVFVTGRLVDAKEPIELLILLEEILRNHRQNMLLVCMLISVAKSNSHKRKRGGRGIPEGCLGALDGTYIHVRVPIADTPRYRNRKGQVSTNTLAVCDRQLRFIYVLPGWEGSAGDSRVLRDAISRPLGLKVPKGVHYDDGYVSDHDDPVLATISTVAPTPMWSKKRDDLAAAMWAERNTV
ncbi:hypothetical protein SASPL_128454 [Salvia splendens]|uniref:DDE Tnp4 domain-containing protein n=1 Tax=Salvia splendens TaxID=180675 RepID=A0A8X8ZMT0_SALSN|nr:hypothetical protein SASPL_128454 [Salvia splendens]